MKAYPWVSMTGETQPVRNPRMGTESVLGVPGEQVATFHKRLPGYEFTELADVPEIASRLGLGRVLVKVESERLGLPSFKMLGASWATYRALLQHTGIDDKAWTSLENLGELLREHGPLRLTAATDGNHGRAVAHFARLLGLKAQIIVPADIAPSRIAAIQSEGAVVELIDGYYDDAIAASAATASETNLVISDTSWEGYEDVPAWVIEGYSTMFSEVDTQLAEVGYPEPTHVITPLGVGALGAATVAHYHPKQPRPSIIGVEPRQAACVQAALQAGRVVTIESEFITSMVGLNCGTASPIAYPTLAHGLDWTIAIEDTWAEEGMRLYAANGLVSGETGAATMGALLALVDDASRSDVALDESACVLLILTEGATDPVNYERIVGKRPDHVLEQGV